MNIIYEIETLDNLQKYLSQQNAALLREELFAEFLKYADYKNVLEWNKAVRICECLAIIGWDNYEPLEAVRTVFYNGNPLTMFCNKFGEARFVDAIWSKRKNGFTMEYGRTSYHVSPDWPSKSTLLSNHPVKEDIQDLKLENQRNWIPKSPILITRMIGNSYKNSKSVLDSIDHELQPQLELKMRSELYGNSINKIVIIGSYSFFDNSGCKTNYIIADEKLKLKSNDFYANLLKIYSKEEIDKNGYFLRNRFEFGSFRSDTGKIKTTIYFEKELREMSFIEQKIKISEHVSEALKTIIDKLKKKKLNYDFDTMFLDFQEILTDWKQKPLM